MIVLNKNGISIQEEDTLDDEDDDDDFYDEEEDRATALNMLTKDDYDIIQDWGKDWMTQHMED